MRPSVMNSCAARDHGELLRLREKWARLLAAETGPVRPQH